MDEDDPRDFIDMYLIEMKKYNANGNATSKYTKEKLVALCMDLFLAGAETTSSTLSWSLMFLALNPQVQKKCQNEIEQSIGEDTNHTINQLFESQFMTKKKRLPLEFFLNYIEVLLKSIFFYT